MLTVWAGAGVFDTVVAVVRADLGDFGFLLTSGVCLGLGLFALAIKVDILLIRTHDKDEN